MEVTTVALPLFIAICVALVGIFISLGVARKLKKTPDQEKFEAHIAQINESELENQEIKEETLDPKTWSGYWLKLYLNTGRTTPAELQGPGRFVIIVAIVAFGIGFLVWPRDIGAGAAFGIGSIVLIRIILNAEVKKRIRTLEKQLPLLLSSMQANLQANATPQSAILASVDEVPSPLRDELLTLKNEIGLNIPLGEALKNLSERVPSREMQFLIASMEIAIESGSNLAPQLEGIQEIITSRTKIRQKLESAIAEVQPALLVSAVTIPASFVFSFYSSPENREFWLSFYGLIGMGVVAFLYAVGLFMSKKLVDGVENT